MNIVVLNGSPKGEYSITLQYVNFIQNKFPQHQFKVIHISQHIKKIEADAKTFQSIIDDVQSADGVLWSFGLWILAVPAQYMRFIELIEEKKAVAAFKNKYTAVISTSIHYFDHTAHHYMRSVCDDLDMKFVEGISLDLHDLEQADARNKLLIFAENFFEAIEQKSIASKIFKPLVFSPFIYQPTIPESRIDNQHQKLLVLTDSSDTGTNLSKMIERFKQSFTTEIETIDLNDVDIRAACLGCMQCGYDYHCVQKDAFTEFYNNRVIASDIIVFAGTIKGRYLSSKWKTFYDRAFFWNHTPSLVGKQMAYIISGPLSQNFNLMQILEASITARQDGNFVDIVTDESEDSATIDAQLQHLASQLIKFSVKRYVKSQNFLAVGGHIIFRDNIWGRLRAVWQADHRYFKKHGKYDFPQQAIKTRLFNAILMMLSKIPQIRKGYYANIKKIPAQRLGKLNEKLK